MEATNETSIYNFIIDASFIEPTNKIINKLNNREFRNCDIKWLDDKLDKYIQFVAEKLNIKLTIKQSESVKPKYMNTYAYEYYNQLLIFFKIILD